MINSDAFDLNHRRYKTAGYPSLYLVDVLFIAEIYKILRAPGGFHAMMLELHVLMCVLMAWCQFGFLIYKHRRVTPSLRGIERNPDQHQSLKGEPMIYSRIYRIKSTQHTITEKVTF